MYIHVYIIISNIIGKQFNSVYTKSCATCWPAVLLLSYGIKLLYYMHFTATIIVYWYQKYIKYGFTCENNFSVVEQLIHEETKGDLIALLL